MLDPVGAPQMNHGSRFSPAALAERIMRGLGARVGRWGQALGARPRLEFTLYAVYAAAWTLGMALPFFASMRQQIGMLYASLGSDPLLPQLLALGPWSAPLDDVFIHFDFARATARGHPFEWSEGNGYSSGGTSLSYPFVLAVGHALGFVDLYLVQWAAIVAGISMLGLLLAVRGLFARLPRWTTYLAPPFLFATGVLDWSLWSGMEVAFFLGVWGLMLALWLELMAACARSSRGSLAWAAALGVVGAVAVGTRPEAASAVAIFGLSAAVSAFRHRGWRFVVGLLALVGAPGVVVIGLQAAVNLALTGDTAAAGAISKLEAHDPYRTSAEVLADWRFFFRYQVERITHYHLSDDASHGVIVWLLALIALIPRQTRSSALVLWIGAASWVGLVAFNGQVRWQNERYTMPALAWLLLAAALGAAALMSLPFGTQRRARALRLGGVGVVALAAALFVKHEAARFREQVWFFGRASRNILEQHVRAGLLIRHALEPRPRRIGVGDAGAISYVADLPALDLIGLGGYGGLPFARAKRHGLGAVLELLEGMPAVERPDLYAIYPSWWDPFAIWFGQPLTEVPVRGNVICAGSAKVLYRPDYRLFEGSAEPGELREGERVLDAVDVADLLSEQAHEYRGSGPRAGHVDMKVLVHPARPERGLWDAGRLVARGATEQMVVRVPGGGRPFVLTLRAAPVQPLQLMVEVGGWAGTLELSASDRWQYPRLTVPAGAVEQEQVTVTLRADASDRVSYHLWIVVWP